MKETCRITREEFNAETGETTVTITTDFGSFTGVTKIDGIDAEYPSLFHGYEIASAKAHRKWARAMKVIIREKMRALNSIIKQMPNCANPQPGSHEAQLVRKEYEAAVEEYELWSRREIAMTESIKNRIKARDMIMLRYANAKENSDKTE